VTVESGNELQVTDNYGVKQDENSFCTPELFQSALVKKGHKREGSLSGHTVVEGGVQWITAKRYEQVFHALTNLKALFGSGFLNAIPGMHELVNPISDLESIIPLRHHEQFQELNSLLISSIQTHDTDTIRRCFCLLNPLYIAESVDDNILPREDTLEHHLNQLKIQENQQQVINWLIASCIINDVDYQETCWNFIRENSLFELIRYPGNCTVIVNEARMNPHDPPPYHIFAYREILGSFSRPLHNVLHAGNQEVFIYGYTTQVFCDILNFLYEGTIEINLENLEQLIRFANTFEIPNLMEYCQYWVYQNMETFLFYSNCIKYAEIFYQHGLFNIFQIMCIRLISLQVRINNESKNPSSNRIGQKISEFLYNYGDKILSFDAQEYCSYSNTATHLQSHEINESFIETLTHFCPNLRTINLPDLMNINDNCLMILMSNCSHLEWLNLSKCYGITEAGFAEAFKKGKPFLKQLYLSSCLIKKGSCLNTSNKLFTFLEVLDLSDCHELTEKGAISLICKLSHLRILNLSGCKKMTDKVVRFISNTCTNMRELNLSGCVKITDKNLTEVFYNLRAINILNLNGCKHITDNPCYIIAKQLPELSEVHLSQTNISDSGISSIVLGLNTLHTLDISKTNATGASVIAISTKASLQSLNIAGCHEIRDEHIDQLAQTNRQLHSLNIDDCKLVTDVSMTTLITNCRYLTSLSMINCDKISKRTIELISRYTPELRVLNVTGCRPETCYAAGEIKQLMPHLQVLN
jgi:BTB/POZ domain/Leucine Rich repeat